MAERTDKQAPNLTERAQEAKREREQRQAEALRANLRRRKTADEAPKNAVDKPKDKLGHG